MSDQHLRIGDAEREQAAATLADHYAAGRLTLAEHSDRLDRVWAARTRGDLRPLFADLPVQRATGRASRPGLPLPLVLLLVVLLALTVVTHLPLILLGLVVYLVLRMRVRRPPCR